jgi:hypothetical protein
VMKRMDRIAVERGSNPVGSNVTNPTKERNDYAIEQARTPKDASNIELGKNISNRSRYLDPIIYFSY